MNNNRFELLAVRKARRGSRQIPKTGTSGYERIHSTWSRAPIVGARSGETTGGTGSLPTLMRGAGAAEAGRIVIQGVSFGGTIAALAMCRDPDLFAAAIIDCAVLDLPFQMRNNPLAWAMVTDKVEQYFGAASGTDAEALLEYSPLDQVEGAHGSFFLTASVSDPIVSVEQTRQYESALRSAGRNVVTRYFEGEGPGYTKWQTRLARARSTIVSPCSKCLIERLIVMPSLHLQSYIATARNLASASLPKTVRLI